MGNGNFMHLPDRSAPRTLARLAATGSAACLLIAGLAVPASAASADTVVVTCEATSSSTINPPLDAKQGSDEAESVNFSGTGKITCRDSSGKIVAEGDSQFSGKIADDECTGEAKQGSENFTVKWSDGTVSTASLSDLKEENTQGSGMLTIKGVTDASSTKFPSYNVEIKGTSKGEGCGTATGESKATQNVTVTFTEPASR
ncbi:hypothetical protein ACFWXK_37795 [Streptomyces sp. NPDC059070]|uniref:hypothetical protein n=1 Tax=Streptomyces sp. NPDC059070 TaxID=3346713 RepID=UPI0036C309F9